MNVQKLSKDDLSSQAHLEQDRLIVVDGPNSDEEPMNIDFTDPAPSTATLQNHQVTVCMPPFLLKSLDSPSFTKNKNINNLNLNLSPVENSLHFSFSKTPPNSLFMPHGQSSILNSPKPTSLTFGGGNLLQPTAAKPQVNEENRNLTENPTTPAITTCFAASSSVSDINEYSSNLSVQTTSNNISTMLKAPPLICEQGPSTPASPTTPNKKRPCPLSVDALQRFDLLSPNYQPANCISSMDSKLSPLSPGYPTSDLGSSPRSSISISHRDSLTTGLAGLTHDQSLTAANWAVFRDFAQGQTRVKRTHSSHSDYGGEEMMGEGPAHYLTPRHALSPAPFSPFSDCCLDSSANTPYSNRSPNLSPLPSSRHFSFEQVQRSRSSMSNRCQSNDISNSKSPCSRRKTKHNFYRNNKHYKNKDSTSYLQQKSLNQEARERSRSEADMLIDKCKRSLTNSNDEDEEMDSIDQSTFSVPLRVSSSFTHSSNGGQYKKRLLQKYRSEQEKVLGKSGTKNEDNPNYSNTSSKDQEDVGHSVSAQPSLQVSRQPTIEEPPPSPTFAELFHSRDLNKERQQQVEEWIRQQAAALEIFRNSLVPVQQESNLLQVPNTSAVPPQDQQTLLLNSSLHLLSPNPNQTLAPGPIKPATLWRRSRSESDVSATTNQSCMPINDAAFICEHCGQGFAMHDRLAKHIASRHRDRSASVNDESSKIHKCTLCPKSFGRSDMLTRHLRLHSGIKPYACQLCGQVFSRSDHLSTHQRTHTGEKPYRCPQCNYAASRRDMITRHMRTHLIDGLINADGSPIAFTEIHGHELQIPPIGQLSLNQPSTPEPPHQQKNHASNTFSQSLFFNSSSAELLSSPLAPVRHLSSPVSPLAGATSLSPAVSSLNLNVTSGSSTQPQTNDNFLKNGGINRSPSLTVTPANELLPPNFSNLFQFKPKMSVDDTSLEVDETTGLSLLSAAAANGSLTHILSSLGKSLDSQVPGTSMRCSPPKIPNLLNQMDHRSAFKPPKVNAQPDTACIHNQDDHMQLAAVTMNGFFGELQQIQATPLHAPPPSSAFSPNLTAGTAFSGSQNSGRLSPSILRQNSIGGIGFSDSPLPIPQPPSSNSSSTVGPEIHSLNGK